MGEPVNKAMLLGDGDLPDTATIRRHCEEAVRIFLAAFGTSGPTG
jgi:hypothetical protein